MKRKWKENKLKNKIIVEFLSLLIKRRIENKKPKKLNMNKNKLANLIKAHVPKDIYTYFL